MYCVVHFWVKPLGFYSFLLFPRTGFQFNPPKTERESGNMAAPRSLHTSKTKLITISIFSENISILRRHPAQQILFLFSRIFPVFQPDDLSGPLRSSNGNILPPCIDTYVQTVNQMLIPLA